jgi:hypothetical protein
VTHNNHASVQWQAMSVHHQSPVMCIRSGIRRSGKEIKDQQLRGQIQVACQAKHGSKPPFNGASKAGEGQTQGSKQGNGWSSEVLWIK